MSLGDGRRAPGDSPQQVNSPGPKHPLDYSSPSAGTRSPVSSKHKIIPIPIP